MTALPIFRAGRIAAFAFFALLTVCTLPFSGHAEDVDATERAKIESVVRDYIMANPEIIVDALKELERREKVAADEKRSAVIAQLVPSLLADPMTPVVGNVDGDVVMVEFFDYQCGYCKRLFPDLKTAMAEDDGLKVVFAEYPILSPASVVAARAAIAAKNQDKYWDFHVALMSHEGRLDETVIMDVADSVGLDTDRLATDMKSDAVTTHLRTVQAMAQALGVTGTPAMVIGDQYVGGYVPLAHLKALFAQARDKAS
ncbi:DsbA family protein [Rhodospirillaceae bacterium KN72]|uniref:DsbA family protein n=1 Tax=Pacificispira spongiicola TaxID=2729598 RepID=A0A7Y0HGS5_9PROT|nr:DsbA family protein [Pacificispira spongiicola]NMM44649.1 DsbA family protein [Pacificispira spongiicola]